jgi:hypothetical protein
MLPRGQIVAAILATREISSANFGELHRSYGHAVMKNLVDLDQFDQDWYIKRYSGVDFTSIDPWHYYIQVGRGLGHFPNAVKEFVFQSARSFDAEWYLNNYKDVRDSGVDPFSHYILYGRREGRRPRNMIVNIENVDSWGFDRDWYLDRYPDVVKSGIDPFTHYILYGRAEGRAKSEKDASYLVRSRYAPFVRKIYRRELSREATEKEISEWTEKLLGGMTCDQMYMQFVGAESSHDIRQNVETDRGKSDPKFGRLAVYAYVAYVWAISAEEIGPVAPLKVVGALLAS